MTHIPARSTISVKENLDSHSSPFLACADGAGPFRTGISKKFLNKMKMQEILGTDKRKRGDVRGENGGKTG